MAMSKLNSHLRVTIQVCDLDELSIREAAQLLGVTISAVKSRLSRGRKILRGTLRRHIGHSGCAD
jgi:DNA-directed RNA polymerase specialized sigma24 family protein